jgi:hypothetical protein
MLHAVVLWIFDNAAAIVAAAEERKRAAAEEVRAVHIRCCILCATHQGLHIVSYTSDTLYADLRVYPADLLIPC